MGSNLRRYTVKRLLQLIPILLGVSIITFLLIRLTPGGPARAVYGVNATPEIIADFRDQYGLGQPIHIQYGNWLWNVLQLDFGTSFTEGVPVTDLLVQRLPVTFSLALGAMTVSLSISIPAGILSALRKDEWPDFLARMFAFSGISVPNFWLGILLVLFVSVRLNLLPIYGYVGPSESLVGWVKHMILPSITLGTALAAIVTRMMRSSLLEELNSEYLKTARMKGVSEQTVILKHALRNSIIPVLTIAGLQLGFILGGSVLVEEVFALPGLGRLLVNAIFSRDFPVVQGTVLLYAVIFVLVNLAVDLIYALIDPRIKY